MLAKNLGTQSVVTMQKRWVEWQFCNIILIYRGVIVIQTFKNFMKNFLHYQVPVSRWAVQDWLVESPLGRRYISGGSRKTAEWPSRTSPWLAAVLSEPPAAVSQLGQTGTRQWPCLPERERERKRLEIGQVISFDTANTCDRNMLLSAGI